jgi:polyphosphate:AMP phosphotransferase
MFDIAEAGSRISKEQFAERVPELRVDLLNAQFDLRSADFSVILLVMGDDRVGCNEVIDRLHEWLDTRRMRTEVFVQPTDEELERPLHWRYWRCLPPRGSIGLLYGGWALQPLLDRVAGEIDDEGFDRRVEHMRNLEEELAADGALVIKFWIHLPKKELGRRLERAEKGSARHWQVEPRDWKLYEGYEEVLALGERMILRTDRAHAPWHLIESTDDRFRDLAVCTLLRDALVGRLAGPGAKDLPEAVPSPESALDGSAGPLATIDLSREIDRKEGKRRVRDLQVQLNLLQRKARKHGISSVLVFEGWDAAGKGSCIRRITRALPAIDYRVIQIAAPTEEERAQHYLWRFWRHLPRAGRMLIFDRSWYGRVLVERVEELAEPSEWQRAYNEINDFEQQLAEHGMAVAKFWLHIDPDEQLARFRAREKTPYKKYKLTAEDYRNRGKWELYHRAADEMIARTDASHAAWHLVSANDKRLARIEVLERVNETLERALEGG